MHTIVHRIRAGTELDLPLAEGSELFCRQGGLRLTVSPSAWEAGMAPAAIVLSPGQGWRADADLRLRISALSSACLELQSAPLPPARDAGPQAMRTAAQALAGWLRGLRRGRRAA